VNGAQTTCDGDTIQRFAETDAVDPAGPYARSKYVAERLLMSVCGEGSMDYAIVRAPLVYGPEAAGRFLWLLSAVARGLPLPLANVRNLRSLLYVDNLAQALRLCLFAPAAANSLFLASDADVSTPELVSQLATALGRKPGLWRCPRFVMAAGGALPVVGDLLRSLSQSLLVDSTLIRESLGWTPRLTLEQGVRATADWYRLRTR